MLDELFAPSPSEVLDVTALTRQIKRRLEGEFGRIWVKGEISNLRRQSSGHVYFSLKDRTSQLPCVLFARDAAQQGFEISDGMELTLLGDISVYEPHGRYQLIAKIAIQSGEGKLQREFERLKRQLDSEGLFDQEQKRNLPNLPKRIAVITSPTGAALRDFLQILERRSYGGDIVIFPSRVQGKEAPKELLGMLQHASASECFDLIVLTRGGGSIEDLWAFNDEALTRAVVACPIPVISAVGHEIDHVMTDYAADFRAETPSGAAELISSYYLDSEARFYECAKLLGRHTKDQIEKQKQRTTHLDNRIRLASPERKIITEKMRLDELENSLKQLAANYLKSPSQKLENHQRTLAQHHPLAQVHLLKEKLEARKNRLHHASRNIMRYHRQALENDEIRLKNNSIDATLRRGYTILHDESANILDTTKKVEEAAQIRAKMQDGEVLIRAKN